MNKRNAKRSALFTSVLALLLCVSMLVGTTFAWFTDEVTSGLNTIAAGNLDIELEHSNAKVNGESVNAETTLFLDVNGEAIKWEPGVVSYENLQVKNVGTLALNYDLVMNIGNENSMKEGGYKLSQVLKVGIVDGGITAAERADVVAAVGTANWTSLADFIKSGSLLPETDDSVQGIVIWWEPSENDNNWNANNGKETTDGDPLYIELGVKLTATQMMHEDDSFDNTYDEDATPVKVASLKELENAIKAGAKYIDAQDANLGDFYYDLKFPDGTVLQNA